MRYDWSEYHRPMLLDPMDPDGWYPDDIPECGAECAWCDAHPNQAHTAPAVTVEASRAVLAYREARDAFLIAEKRADEAWTRWWVKRTGGIATNGAQAARLENEANYLSADLAGAQLAIFRYGIDPATVDAQDSVEREIHY